MEAPLKARLPSDRKQARKGSKSKYRSRSHDVKLNNIESVCYGELLKLRNRRSWRPSISNPSPTMIDLFGLAR